MKVNLKPFQDQFIFSKAKFPAFAGGWATGKTMCGIIRGMLYSEHIPDNLGIIFRKEFTDLRDSTMKDFEKYTGIKINSRREVVLSNKSTIMFRHIEELNNIQNVNLGWFLIEQADELDSDMEFFLLFGRLRRAVQPDKYFKDLGLNERSGFCIANAGDHWMKPVFLEEPIAESELVQAETKDNADVLPPDFLETLETLKKNHPSIYKQFVVNDWNATRDNLILIHGSDLSALQSYNDGKYPDTREVVSLDPSMGGDECVAYFMRNYNIIDELIIIDERDTMKVAGMVSAFGMKHNCSDFAIDSIGIGAGIADRLKEIGKNVIRIVSSEAACDKDKHYNKKTEMWCNAQRLILDKKIPEIRDPKIRKQLTAVRFKIVNSSGKVQLESKEVTKKRIKESPDRADAFIYGCYAMDEVDPNNVKDMYVYKPRRVMRGWKTA